MPMAIVGILLIMLAPLLFGVGISCRFRERNVGCLKGYLVGFLSLFAMLFIETLAMLKLDLSMQMFEWIAVGTMAGMATVGAILLIVKRPGFARPKLNAHMLYFLVPAAMLFMYSYFYLAPSYVNDDTWEIVSTSLAKGSIYEYSAMTGKLIEQGLPIFNKIYVMPLLYITLADFFDVPMAVSAGLLIPAIVFVLNLAIVYAIGKKLEVADRSYFMIVYMLVLMAGTYLPSFGVPVTVGYPLLREGYCGYAVAYGVVIPAAVLLLLNKKYVWAIVAMAVNAPLVRIDRIFFALMSPIKNVRAINTAGKIAAVYVVAVVAALVLATVKKQRVKWQVLWLPGVFVAYMSETLKNFAKEKHGHVWYSVGIAVVILATVNFQPYNDAVTRSEQKQAEESVKATLEDIKPGKIVWAPEEFMEIARRIDGNSVVLVGRDDNNSYMAGLDYEAGEEMAQEYRHTLNNIAIGRYVYVTKYDEEYVVQKALEAGAYYMVLPDGNGYKVTLLTDYKAE